jgi:hypothetical protein
MKIVAYTTNKAVTNNIIKNIAEGIPSCEILEIDDHAQAPLVEADLYIISGFLRGTGLILKKCIEQNKRYMFIDHAYFSKGYKDPCWMRVCLNNISYDVPSQNFDNKRFLKHFEYKYKLEKWKGAGKKSHILILPPTGATAWAMNASDWLDDTIKSIQNITDTKIIVRQKPDNPIVDNLGNLIKMEKTENPRPLEDDIRTANAVVIYNSNSAIEITKYGKPIICHSDCAAKSISFDLKDLKNLKAFNEEPNRAQLFNNLSWNQFTLKEMKDGLPLRVKKLI